MTGPDMNNPDDMREWLIEVRGYDRHDIPILVSELRVMVRDALDEAATVPDWSDWSDAYMFPLFGEHECICIEKTLLLNGYSPQEAYVWFHSKHARWFDDSTDGHVSGGEMGNAEICSALTAYLVPPMLVQVRGWIANGDA